MEYLLYLYEESFTNLKIYMESLHTINVSYLIPSVGLCGHVVTDNAIERLFTNMLNRKAKAI